MRDEDLKRALASLPREQVGKEFTAQVLDRISERPKTVSRPWRLAVAAAVLFALLAGGREAWHRRERHSEVQRFVALQQEYLALEAEVQRLRSLRIAARPVVYLGGDGEVDLMVDLSQIQRSSSTSQPGVLAESTGEDSSVPSKVSQEALKELLRARSGAPQIY